MVRLLSKHVLQAVVQAATTTALHNKPIRPSNKSAKSSKALQVQKKTVSSTSTELPAYLQQACDFEAQMVAIQQAISEVIKEEMNGVELHPEQPFMASGISSAQTVRIATAISSQLGVAISPVDMFNQPTIASLSEYVATRLGVQPSVPEEQWLAPVCQPSVQACVAVMGSEFRAPVAEASAAPWQLMSQAHNSVQRIPAQRFDVGAAVQAAPELLYVQHGHFVAGAELFEARLFGMSPAECHATDPSHRVLLEAVLGATVQAGHSKGSLLGTATGMFLGICNVADWSSVQRDTAAKPSVFGAHGSDGGAAAGRVSYLFGLKGPCFSVNTACSSSLVALDAACQNLQLRTCTRSLVAGVCLHLHASSFMGMCALHALSGDGQCKTFGSSADGYGRSEACGAVLLEQLSSSMAVRVEGSAVNQDGRSASFMAPNGPSQVAVVQAAMKQCGKAVVCVETHGTGTALGDPIEVGALHRVLQGVIGAEPVVLGARKSQMAHSEGAAGMAGLVKVVQVLERCCMVPNLHLQQVNPKLELDGFATVLASECCVLRMNDEVLMGVSSFGYSGTNSHAVLASSPEPEAASVRAHPLMQYQHSAFVWWDTSSTAAATEAMPLLGVSTAALEAGSGTQWERSWPSATCSYMAQHRVGCTPVAPGTGYLCMVREALMVVANGKGGEVLVSQAQFTAMLFLDGAAPVVRVCVEPEGEQSSGVRIESSVAAAGWVQHAMVVATVEAEVVGEVAVGSISDGSTGCVSGASLYGSSTGNEYLGGFWSVDAEYGC